MEFRKAIRDTSCHAYTPGYVCLNMAQTFLTMLGMLSTGGDGQKILEIDTQVEQAAFLLALSFIPIRAGKTVDSFLILNVRNEVFTSKSCREMTATVSLRSTIAILMLSLPKGIAHVLS
jgi:hypothetical protein